MSTAPARSGWRAFSCWSSTISRGSVRDRRDDRSGTQRLCVSRCGNAKRRRPAIRFAGSGTLTRLSHTRSRSQPLLLQPTNEIHLRARCKIRLFADLSTATALLFDEPVARVAVVINAVLLLQFLNVVDG